jgi:hypothetical protein
VNREELQDAPPSETWLTRLELAGRWKMPPATLAQWASQGRGPRYGTFGRHVRYRLSDVIQWESEQFDGGTALSAKRPQCD